MPRPDFHAFHVDQLSANRDVVDTETGSNGSALQRAAENCAGNWRFGYLR
jgi:hypothetical protein